MPTPAYHVPAAQGHPVPIRAHSVPAAMPTPAHPMPAAPRNLQPDLRGRLRSGNLGERRAWQPPRDWPSGVPISAVAATRGLINQMAVEPAWRRGDALHLS